MNRRHRSSLVLGATVLACGVLGLLLHASRLRAENLRAALAAMSQVAPPEPAPAMGASAAAPPDATLLTTTEERRELAERTALLEAARRVPEVARREAALRAIKELQAAHAAVPPTPRPVPPPVPRDAQYFAELLDDPEYLQLVAQNWRQTSGAYFEGKLARLGVPEEARRRIIELEFDSHTAFLDSQRYARRDASERTAASAASSTLRQENSSAIEQLLGKDAFAAYRDPVGARPSPDPVPLSVFDPLALRLSYSGSPLDSATRQRLADLVQSMDAPAPGLTLMPRTPEFIERARSVLQPGQIAALEELRAEYEAARARRQLPKSSELPRTTRRERLETTTK